MNLGVPAVCATADAGRGEKRLSRGRIQAILTSNCPPLGECWFEKCEKQMGIDATKVMQRAKQFIDAKGAYDTVKGVNDTLSKVEKEMKKKPEAQDWAGILMSRDPTLDKAIKEFQRQTKEATYLVKCSVDWPKDNTEKLINEAAKVAKKDGVDGPKIKKVVATLMKDLEDQNTILIFCMYSAKTQSKKCDKRIATIKATRKYLKVLESYFMTLTSIGISGGMQAQAFSLARQCLEAYGEAGNLERALVKLSAAYDGFYKHAEKLQESVMDWIDIAGSDGLKFELEQRMR
jgi:hypothetical protein